MTLLQIYRRVIALLAPEKTLAISLALASVAIGLVQLAEPILFGRVVDALSKGDAVHSPSPTLSLRTASRRLPMPIAFMCWSRAVSSRTARSQTLRTLAGCFHVWCLEAVSRYPHGNRRKNRFSRWMRNSRFPTVV